MISIACSACQKKLSVKEILAGKKVKCPGCGQLVAVPAQVPISAAGNEDMRTLPPVSRSDALTPAPAQADASSQLTNPPSDKPDATQGVKPDAGHDSSLTDFLAAPQADDELGRLGKYRILKILGYGGMGVVYKAEDPKLKRTVAIKAMLPTLAASASSGKRFLREAQTMAAVKHDNIVNIFDVDEDRGVPFMAMEFLMGEPLDERLKRDEALPLADMLRIGREIAEGLAAAHGSGLIHRDIKPANIWLEAPRNRVKILDFGLARAATQDAGLTQQGSIIGTPAYMAPEQGRGDDVDARCDLFSLGVVLYRMTTGDQPFHGKDTVSTLMAVAMHEPTPPRKLNAKLPQELADLVMGLLEKDAAKRTASADEVVKALQGMEKELARKQASTEDTIGQSYAPRKKATAAKKANAGDTQTALPSPGTPGEGPGVRASRRSKLPLVLAALALLALLGGGGTLAVIVYYLQTNNGVIRIEINDPDIKVSFDKNGPIISGVDKQDIKLTPGEFGLYVERGDLKFDTDKFILKKGETITLKIEWFPEGKLQVVQGDKVLGKKERPKVDVAVGPPPAGDYALLFDGDGSLVEIPSLHVAAHKEWCIEAKIADDAGRERATIASEGLLLHFLRVSNVNDDSKWSFNTNGITVGGYGRKVTHIAAVRKGDELKLFVNGKLSVDKPGTANKFVDSGDFLLGTIKNKKFFKGTQFFKGTMDEVRISKVARYDKDFTPPKRFEPDADTLALYHFDEGAGDVLKDSSGNGHHGKIVGAKWVNADGTPITSAPLARLSPLDALDPKLIPAAEQYKDQPKELVAVLVDFTGKDPRRFLAVTADGKRIISGGSAGIHLWDVPTVAHVEIKFPGNGLMGIAAGPDGLLVSASKFNDNTIKFWDIFAPEPLKSKKEIKLAKTTHLLVALSLDGRYLAAGQGWSEKPNDIILWELDAGEPKERAILKGHEAQVLAMAFSPDGKYLASTSWDRTLRLWDVAGGKQIWSVSNEWGNGAKSTLPSVAFAPDGLTLVAGTGPNHKAVFWDVGTGKEVRRLGKNYNVWCVAYAPDGKTLACGSAPQPTILWDLKTGMPLAEWHFPDAIRALAYSADGRHLLLSSENGRVYVLRLAAPPIAAAPVLVPHALRFSGKHKVEIPTLQVDPAKPFTFEGWITPDAQEAKKARYIMEAGGLASIRVMEQKEGPVWSFTLGVEGSGSTAVTGPLVTGQRVHVAGVRTDSQIRLFVNGKLLSSKKLPAGALLATEKMSHLGGRQNAYFHGLIGEVRFSQVARYTEEFTPAKRFEPDADTLALYHFDEGAGDVLKDSSGNNHHGKIVGATWVKADGTAIAPAPPADTWVQLFNGKDLAGWKTHPSSPGQWNVVDGILTGSGSQKNMLFSERSDYEDFHFRVEAMINAPGNSGQFFRTEFAAGLPKGYEAQISLSDRPQQTGSLYGIVKINEPLHKPDEWFTQEVIAIGDHIRIKVNDKVVVDTHSKLHSRGHFALQLWNAATVVKFRKIEVKELPR